ncbi:MAG: TIR domain-containing protein [Rhodanobacteraceae bacterium]
MPESSSPSPFAYRAFISYSHRDKAWADWLHKSLEAYRVPSRLVGRETAAGTIPSRLHPIFRDREELASATDLGRKVNEALSRSQNLIVICSPASATSRWVNEEVLAYKRMGRAGRVFCLIVDGEPDATDMPGRESEECFCPALRFAADADGSRTNERTEPIAADARAGKDGKTNAKLKLIAGMLDVGFDALKQREQRRQLQRMTALASVALAVMAVTIVLAAAAFVSRHQAVTAEHRAQAAQRVAVVAKQAAERRQKQAEDLVYFMLGDLTLKLQAQSQLGTLNDVFDKAMAYFKSLPPVDVNGTTLDERVLALDRIGDNRMRQGQLAGALDAFHTAAAAAANLTAAEPANVDRHVEYSRILTYICMINLKQGRLVEAGRACDTGRNVLQPALRRAPSDLDLLQQLSYVESNSGHVQQSLGNLASANTDFDAFLTVARKLIAAKPDAVYLWPILNVAHLNLADLAMQRGDLAAAIAQYRAATTAGDAATSRFPKNNPLLNFAAKARGSLGNALSLAGDSAAGVADLQQTISVAENLILRDPTNTDYQSALGGHATQLAHCWRIAGNVPEARRLSSQGTQVLAALVKKDPGNTDWQNDYGRALIEQSAEMYAAGDTQGARASAQHALQILEPMLAKHPERRDTLLPAMQARLLLASATPDRQAAHALREQTLRTMAVKGGPSDPRLLALQVETLLALDRKPDAQPLIKQLWNEGYRDPEFIALLQREYIDYPANPGFPARLAAATAHAADPATAATEAAAAHRQGANP